MYIGFLMSEPKSATCTRLAEVMGISQDSVNRFLLREAYEPKEVVAAFVSAFIPDKDHLNPQFRVAVNT
jgi:hypothetical protein